MATKYSLKDLTENERNALLSYKSSESYKINAKLRGEDSLTAEDEVFVRHMDSALTKMPTHTGRVYRSITFDGIGDKVAFDTFMADVEPGGFMQPPAYISTSTTEDGYPLEGQYVVRMVIEGHNGRDMSGVGNNFESEVLFERDRQFTIEKVAYGKDGTPTIYMKEAVTDEADQRGSVGPGTDGPDLSRRNGAGHESVRDPEVQQVQGVHSGDGDVSGVSQRDSQGNLRESESLSEVRGEGEDEAKHSLKAGTLTKSYSAILEENRLLREQTKDYLALQRRNRALEASRDYWQGQTRRTQQVTTDRKAVEKAAKALVKRYGAELSAEEVQGIQSKLQHLYDYMASGREGKDELTYSEARRRAEEIGRALVEHAAEKDDAFYRQTAKLFAEVIDQTQVVDSVLQRSNIMRSSNAVVKQATSFMGEPIMSLNLLMRAYDQVRYEQNSQKRGKAIKTMGRAATALVVTNVVNALALYAYLGVGKSIRNMNKAAARAKLERLRKKSGN